MAASLPLMKGTLDVLVLKALSWTAMHGLEITSWLEERSGGELSFDDSAVYQALYRMEERGLVEAHWGVSDNNRKARYYRITSAGRSYLQSEGRRLTRYGELVVAILGWAPQSS
jgi:PadR family transcriptional regulator